ncbi:MAG: enoyl-CoA hydratase/isomerase family protein [Salibacteraceae bacterium]
MKEAYVNLTIEKGVGTVEFFHPQSNSLPGSVLKELAQKITEAGEHSEVRVVLLKSGGDRAFCAGASFDELIAIENHEQGLEFFSGFARVINAMRKCPKFIIGRVQGKAVGGGVGLAASVDYCFATRHASIKLSELAIGIGPFVVGPAVERKVGKSAFMELTIDAENWRTAEWALQKGLFQHVFDSTTEMDDALKSFSLRLANYNPDAMKELKQIAWAGTETWDDLLFERAAISGKLVLSDFTKSAIEKFKAR